MYKDRYGKRIRQGDVVARAISINNDHFQGFNFATFIVKKIGKRLVLDGVHTQGFLAEAEPREMVVLDESVDLRKVDSDFYREFCKHWEENFS